MRQPSYILAIIILLIISCCTLSCSQKKTSNEEETIKRIPDTLIVGTLYSPTSYFLYKSDIMGYNYDLITRLAEDKNITIKFELFRSLSSLLERLDSAQIDLAAYNTPITAEFNHRVTHCGIESITRQVLIQPSKKGDELITDVTQLVGKEIYVEKGSKYESRLQNLNSELGGGIKIHTINRDTIMSEDLISMVANNEIPLTVVDNDIAQLDHTYYANIDISLEISFPQRSSWSVKKGNEWLADSINLWANTKEIQRYSKRLFNHYFATSRNAKQVIINVKNLQRGIISKYDSFFKESAKTIGWDWKLLAAQGYVESNFNPSAVSWAGARGIMQLMPGTAQHYGLDAANIEDPQSNIHAASKSIRDLNRSLSKYVEDEEERKKFIIAAYNSGIAHIYDAIALAKKYGKDPQIWDNNVCDALLMKRYPEYYNDDVCKYGYFGGKQTVKYVESVTNTYNLFKKYVH